MTGDRISRDICDGIYKTCLAILCWISFTKQKEVKQIFPSFYTCLFWIRNGFAAGSCKPISQQKGAVSPGCPIQFMHISEQTSTWSCKSCQNDVNGFYFCLALFGVCVSFLVLIFRLKNPAQLCIRSDEPACWALWLADPRWFSDCSEHRNQQMFVKRQRKNSRILWVGSYRQKKSGLFLQCMESYLHSSRQIFMFLCSFCRAPLRPPHTPCQQNSRENKGPVL